MKNLKKTACFTLISAVLFLLIFINSCKKEDKAATSPAIPPISTLQMDFSGFSSTKKSAIIADTNYWQVSALAVLVWTVRVAVVTALPIAAFKASFQNKAVYLGNNVWQWSYTVNANSDVYTATLKATLEADSVDWKFNVTKTGTHPFTDFLWFSGKSEYALSGGWWLLNESPEVPGKFLKIDWKRQNDSIGSLKYTYVKLTDPTKTGSYIEFGKTDQNGIFNAFYNLYAIDTDDNGQIQWSTITKEGRIKDHKFFNNSNWHCWNSNRVNSTCP